MIVGICTHARRFLAARGICLVSVSIARISRPVSAEAGTGVVIGRRSDDTGTA